jgi:hypothetical protein
MSFDNDHPNRKDHRKPYRKSKIWDLSCRNHGSCGYCRKNREYRAKQREQAAEERLCPVTTGNGAGLGLGL